MQLPAHCSATMAYQFSDLPNDLMEMVFEALPSVYQIYKCSLVCRAWHGPAWRVLERRRAAIIARSTKFQTWHEGSKPSPEQRVFTEYAHAVDRCGPRRSVLHADGESILWASEQQINHCTGKKNLNAGFWIGPTSTVNSICAVGPNCIAATLHAYSDPWDDSLEAQTSLERGHSRHYLVLYSLATSDEVWHVELPLHSSYQGMSPIVVASPNANRLIVVAGTGVAHYRVSHRNDKGDPTAYFLAWRGGIGAGAAAVLLCGDKELFVGGEGRAVTVFDHDRPHAVARTLRNNPGVEDGVSSMCFVDKAQQHLCIATENGSLETRCAKYGTLLLRFPDLARRFVGDPQVMLTKDGDVLVSHRAYNTRDGMMRGWRAAIVPVVL